MEDDDDHDDLDGATRPLAQGRLRDLVDRTIGGDGGAFLVGDRVGDYELLAVLGSGGFGNVYEVAIEGGARRAALKLLHERHLVAADVLARFEREAAIVRQVRHPNLVEIYEVGAVDGRPYFVMERLDGATVADRLRERGRFTPSEVLEIVAPVCDALEALHARAIVHRDVKPSNVFVCADGRVVLLDLGIAKPLGAESLTRSNQYVGTPAYMSPEQREGRPIDARTDVYQLGAMIFELLTGRPPYELANRFQAPSQVIPALTAAIDDVVLTATRLRPEERYATTGELTTALRQAVEPLRPAVTRRTVAVHLEVYDAADRDPAPVMTAWQAHLEARGFVVAGCTDNSMLLAASVAAIEPAIDWTALGVELLAVARRLGFAAEIALEIGDVDWIDRHPIGGPLLALDWVTGRPGLHVGDTLITGR